MIKKNQIIKELVLIDLAFIIWLFKEPMYDPMIKLMIKENY